jgi:hypothetical protein
VEGTRSGSVTWTILARWILIWSTDAGRGSVTWRRSARRRRLCERRIDDMAILGPIRRSAERFLWREFDLVLFLLSVFGA